MSWTVKGVLSSCRTAFDRRPFYSEICDKVITILLEKLEKIFRNQGPYRDLDG